MKPPERITLAMSPFPAWMWDIHGPDGLLIKRFKSDEHLFNWLERNGYEIGGAE